MKKIISIFLFISLFCILINVRSANAACASASAAQTPVNGAVRSSFNVLKMNTMSPANFRYPDSYAHTTTRVVRGRGFTVPSSSVAVNPYGGNNVNIYVGTPVYLMRSGAVYIDGKRSRNRHLRKIYYEPQYYEYYEY